jgi:hypothetical protein
MLYTVVTQGGRSSQGYMKGPDMALSDRKLAELAKERDTLDARIKKLTASKKKRDQAIIKELERRGTKALDVAGVKITKVQGEIVEYDYDELKDVLGAAKFRAITKPVLDKDLLAKAVAKNRVELATVNSCATIRLKAPYILVSQSEDAE